MKKSRELQWPCCLAQVGVSCVASSFAVLPKSDKGFCCLHPAANPCRPVCLTAGSEPSQPRRREREGGVDFLHELVLANSPSSSLRSPNVRRLLIISLRKQTLQTRRHNPRQPSVLGGGCCLYSLSDVMGLPSPLCLGKSPTHCRVIFDPYQELLSKIEEYSLPPLSIFPRGCLGGSSNNVNLLFRYWFRNRYKMPSLVCQASVNFLPDSLPAGIQP